MKFALTLFSVGVIAALIGVSVWATGHVSIVPVIKDLLSNPTEGGNPWQVATLFDAYFGFLWFWLWIAYKETSWTSRLAWLVGVLLLGNMAMGAYMLVQLWTLPPNPTAKDLLLRRPA
tara:strand:- start:2791 stop:3144 length:354 start_codon:yes stop_codon:yes gene_type:complete